MYNIFAHARGADFKTLICTVGCNPGPIVEGLRRKRFRFGKRNVPRYVHVEAVEVPQDGPSLLGATP
jgi:hypothetical protein